MKKVTQKYIKDYIRNGMAIDITNSSDLDVIQEPYEKEAYSVGVYGINGGLLRGLNTGNFYAIVGRSTILFRYF